MESWQVSLLIIFSMLVGALIPIMVMIFLTLWRAYKRLSLLVERLGPTIEQVQIIAQRVEVMSRGLEGQERNVADVVEVSGELARRVERYMSLVSVASTVMAAVVPAVTAFIRARQAATTDEESEASCRGEGQEDGDGDDGTSMSPLQPRGVHEEVRPRPSSAEQSTDVATAEG